MDPIIKAIRLATILLILYFHPINYRGGTDFERFALRSIGTAALICFIYGIFWLSGLGI